MTRDPLTEAIRHYLEEKAEPSRPVSINACFEEVKPTAFFVHVSDVALEQRIAEAAIQHGLSVAFDRRGRAY
jgi:hypothetical protein